MVNICSLKGVSGCAVGGSKKAAPAMVVGPLREQGHEVGRLMLSPRTADGRQWRRGE